MTNDDAYVEALVGYVRCNCPEASKDDPALICNACHAREIVTAIRRDVHPLRGPRFPRIVCLCGSTRFQRAFEEANARETTAGRIVLSVGRFVHGEGVTTDYELKRTLDELHKRKIDLADEVLVLDVGGYIGSSTQSEINYARARRKPVRFLSHEQRVGPQTGGDHE